MSNGIIIRKLKNEVVQQFVSELRHEYHMTILLIHLLSNI